MWRYIFWKVITSMITMVIITILFYLLYVGIKGNPFANQRITFQTPAAYNAKLNEFNINSPIIVRFWYWLVSVFKGEWGDVYIVAGNKTIPELLFEPLTTSMLVMIPSFFIGMVFGLILGFIAGYNKGKWPDVVINGFVTLFIAVPAFVLAAFALIIGPILGLPVVFQSGKGTSILIQSLIMPIIVMTVLSLASWTYLTRIEVSKILASDYILAAKTRGFSQMTIFRKYVFRNSMYPYAGSLATSFMVVFGSSLIVEKFFNVDGVSTLLLQASKSGEINILMFNMVFFLFLGLFTQVIADIAQFTINPIVRSSFSSKSSPIKKLSIAIKRNKNRKKISISNQVGDK